MTAERTVSSMRVMVGFLGLPVGQHALAIVRLNPASQEARRDRKPDTFASIDFELHAREPAVNMSSPSSARSRSLTRSPALLISARHVVRLIFVSGRTRGLNGALRRAKLPPWTQWRDTNAFTRLLLMPWRDSDGPSPSTRSARSAQPLGLAAPPQQRRMRAWAGAAGPIWRHGLKDRAKLADRTVVLTLSSSGPPICHCPLRQWYFQVSRRDVETSVVN